MKKSLLNLGEKELSDILSNFGRVPRIFHSEAQFQFELAWKLQEEFDCVAKLEELTVLCDRKKAYTDIILENDGYRVAIELKYKTAELNCNNILLFNHGAPDLGRYDFLWDVNRLELLVHNAWKKKIEQEITKEKCKDVKVWECKKGFAVLLTNEDSYWKKTYGNAGNVLYKDFCIGEDYTSGKGQLGKSSLDWKKGANGSYTKAIKGTFRARKITLKERYSYQWKGYGQINNCKNGLFKFVIIEVK